MTTIAVIKTGGKQYLVEEGSVVTIEKIKGQKDLEKGDKLTFDDVLLTDDGKAVALKGGKVEGEVIAVGKGKKVTVVRYKPKSRYLKKRGHRQPFTKVKITKV